MTQGSSPSPYRAAGVDSDRADSALARLAAHVRTTWPTTTGIGAVQLDLGYYANVVDIGGGMGLALSADGVGTKVLVAQLMERYDTVGIDCVAMNVNDLLCVGARPLSLVDYLAVQDADPEMLAEIAKGLAEGARLAGISIPGGEIAQLQEIVIGARPGAGFDLAAAAVGLVRLDRIIIGRDVTAGDVLVGVESNGIHSNGLTLARHILFERHGYDVTTVLPEIGTSLGAELLRPTHIYVREALAVLDAGIPVKAMMHITGDGFLNLSRIESPHGFVVDALPPLPPIFALIQRLASIPDDEMYRVFNMGVGFCFVVPPDAVDQTIAIVHAHGKQAQAIGTAVADPVRRIQIPSARLISQGKRFIAAD
jgi:phosphoribosylformylglycinamidine cyclo-ligase